MTTNLRRGVAVGAAAFLLLGLAGCSDDGDDASSDATTTTAAAEAEDPTTTGGEASEPASGSGDAVTMEGIAFAPDAIEVAAGAEVTWTNLDSATHTVTADDGSFDSGDVEQDGTFSQTFDEAGTFSYVCAIHATMSGEVVVS